MMSGIVCVIILLSLDRENRYDIGGAKPLGKSIRIFHNLMEIIVVFVVLIKAYITKQNP